jgi:hypothetical protein
MTPQARTREAEQVWLVREQLDRENEHLTSRTTWILASQAFLITAYAMCVTGSANIATNPRARTLELLVQILPWTAIAALLSLYVTIAGALFMMSRLHRSARRAELSGPWALYDENAPRVAGLVGPLLSPAVFLVTWIVILLGK